MSQTAPAINPLPVNANTPTAKPAPSKASKSPQGEPCQNCGSTKPSGDAGWCPSCGYYPVLGRCMEAEPEKQTAPDVNSIFDLLKLVPAWGWTLAGGIAALVVLSVVARVTTADAADARQAWALSQIALGLVVFGGAHLAAYLYAVIGTSGIGIIDIFMKPIQVWEPTLKELPAHAWRLWFGVWGLSASVFAVLIVGGIQYSSMFDDWGFRKGAQPNLVHSIVSQARQEREGGAESLEEAMNDFAGDAEAAAKAAEAKDLLNEPVRDKTVDCLIFGYQENGSGSFDAILLGSVVNNRIRFVSRVPAEELPEAVRQELNVRLRDPNIARPRPFVKSLYEAKWLKPVLLCQVDFEDWTPNKHLKSPKFKTMLADAGTQQ